MNRSLKFESIHKMVNLVKIPNNKQIPMTKIQNPKQKNNRFEPVWNLVLEICLRFGA